MAVNARGLLAFSGSESRFIIRMAPRQKEAIIKIIVDVQSITFTPLLMLV